MPVIKSYVGDSGSLLTGEQRVAGASAQTWHSIASGLTQLSDQLSQRLASVRKEQGEREGVVQGLAGTGKVRQDVSVYSEAYNRSLLGLTAHRSTMQGRTGIDELEASHPEDIASFRGLAEKHYQGVISEANQFDPTLGAMVQERLEPYLADSIDRVRLRSLNKDDSIQKSDSSVAIQESINDILGLIGSGDYDPGDLSASINDIITQLNSFTSRGAMVWQPDEKAKWLADASKQMAYSQLNGMIESNPFTPEEIAGGDFSKTALAKRMQSGQVMVETIDAEGNLVQKNMQEMFPGQWDVFVNAAKAQFGSNMRGAASLSFEFQKERTQRMRDAESALKRGIPEDVTAEIDGLVGLFESDSEKNTAYWKLKDADDYGKQYQKTLHGLGMFDPSINTLEMNEAQLDGHKAALDALTRAAETGNVLGMTQKEGIDMVSPFTGESAHKEMATLVPEIVASVGPKSGGDASEQYFKYSVMSGGFGMLVGVDKEDMDPLTPDLARTLATQMSQEVGMVEGPARSVVMGEITKRYGKTFGEDTHAVLRQVLGNSDLSPAWSVAATVRSGTVSHEALMAGLMLKDPAAAKQAYKAATGYTDQDISNAMKSHPTILRWIDSVAGDNDTWARVAWTEAFEMALYGRYASTPEGKAEGISSALSSIANDFYGRENMFYKNPRAWRVAVPHTANKELVEKNLEHYAFSTWMIKALIEENQDFIKQRALATAPDNIEESRVVRTYTHQLISGGQWASDGSGGVALVDGGIRPSPVLRMDWEKFIEYAEKGKKMYKEDASRRQTEGFFPEVEDLQSDVRAGKYGR